MELTRIQYVSLLLQYHARQLGGQGLVGIVLLISTLIFSLAIAIPKLTALKQLSTDVSNLQKEIPLHKGKWIDHSPQASLTTFYHALPSEKETTALVSLVMAAAQDNGLTPAKADYSLNRSNQASFTKYQITLPIHGSYMQVRRFSNQVLTTIPSAALNEIGLKRPDINTDQVDAQLKFTIYLKSRLSS